MKLYFDNKFIIESQALQHTLTPKAELEKTTRMY